MNGLEEKIRRRAGRFGDGFLAASGASSSRRNFAGAAAG